MGHLEIGWGVKEVIVFGMVLGTCLTLVLTGHTSADSVIALIVGVMMKAPVSLQRDE